MTQSGAHVLVIEDEQSIRHLLRASLSHAGYRVSDAATADKGLKDAAREPPDLVILDLGLPDLDGQEALARLREWFTGPVLVLSARDQEAQKVRALDQGADDYVTKPFGTGELLARLRAALRHRSQIAAAAPTMSIGDLRFDLEARLVYRREELVHLTPLEYKLLTTLVKHAGKVLTHRFLLREVWGPHDSQENHYLRVFVAGLRKKIEDDTARPRYLLTEQGIGYRFAAE